MRKFIQWTLLLVIVCGGASLYAASPSEFYLSLLRRGISEVEAGRNEAAVTPLRLAAFGLIESVDHYETAQVYLAIAFDRLQQSEGAREATMRILAAERIERRFASLSLSEPVRTAFTGVARKVLPAADAARLLSPSSSAPATAPASQQQQQQPQTSTTQRVANTQRTPVVEKPKPAPEQPKPAPVQPAAATTTKPAPAAPKIDVAGLLAAGDRAVASAKLNDARRAYRQLLNATGLDHATWIRVAEGLYRSRDFAGALQAFERVGTLRAGEEAYRYYIAVAAYETGQHERAKRELAGALPYIEVTPDVERYRARIENAR